MLATQLERAGFSALRFDYAGTGDSLGSSEEVSVDQWLRDIDVAAQKLLDVSGARGIALVGLRFGASLAMLASTRGGLRPRHLLMWDPIVDGGVYLRELVAQHAAYMREEIGPSWQDRTRKHPSGAPAEAFGAPISRALADEISAIDLAGTQPAADHISVVSTKSSAESERLRASLPHAKWIEMTGTTAWNSDAALNSMIVPMEVVQTLLAQLEKAL